MAFIGLWLAVLLALLPATAPATPPSGAGTAAAAVDVGQLDPEECESFAIVGTIMEVHPERGVIVVAEREIRGLHAAIGEKTFKTQYLDEAGKPRVREAFRKGETVAVEGFRHPEGYVAALRLQKLEKRPPAPRVAFKPVEDSRRKFRHRISPAAAAPRR